MDFDEGGDHFPCFASGHNGGHRVLSSGGRMPSTILLTVALLLAAGTALAKMSECDARCENTYKYCTTSGKMSQRACMVELEKCRKACLKQKKKEGG
jgi:hypothetical protein